MAGLSNEHKVTARTVVEVTEGIARVIIRFGRSPLRFRAGPGSRQNKVKIEAIVGSILLDFLALPEAAQDAMIARRLPELQALVLGEPIPAASAAQPARHRRIPVTIEHLRPEGKGKGKGKDGGSTPPKPNHHVG